MLTDWPDSWVTNVQRYWGFRVIILQLSAAFWGGMQRDGKTESGLQTPNDPNHGGVLGPATF